MIGKRLPDGSWPENAGEYCKDEDGRWIAVPPDGCGIIMLTRKGPPEQNWTVTEHEDGTISVSPSIHILGEPGKPDRWHGYLERGIWREC